MRLIKRVDIRNFRSLRSTTLPDLGEYVPIAGLNGSGKSNLLRALSLFFNGEIEPRVPLDLKRDHFNPGRPLGGRRRASVRVTFDLSGGYSPRKEVEALFGRLGVGDSFVVERAWSYADPSGTAVVEELRAGPNDDGVESLDEQDLQAMGTFIRSIQLRYVPNHIRPSDLLDEEIQTLRRAINRRVRTRSAFRTGRVQEALDDLGAVTEDMLGDVSRQVAAHSPELSSIVPEIPNDFADLAFQLGLATVTSTGLRQAPELQGSGTQSYLLYHVLDLIDRSAFEVDFGWTKAVLWAIEEPESFLHAGLRSRLSEDLRRFAEDDRRQVFLTTHEPEFQRSADSVWIAERDGATTTFTSADARDAIVESSRLRISSYQHPLHLSPDRPLVIAEGDIDCEYLRLAAERIDLKPMWTLVSLRDLEESKQGGDDVENYLRANPSVLRSRALHAPVIVLRDWEDNDNRVNSMRSALEVHPTSTCIRPPATLCNPQLGQKFRGIERFLDTGIIEQEMTEVVRPKNIQVRYPLQVDKTDLDAAKRDLLRAVRQAEPGQYLEQLVRWVDEEVQSSVGAASTRQMLLPY